MLQKISFLIVSALCLTACNNTTLYTPRPQEIAIIPEPQSLERTDGFFEFDSQTVFVTTDEPQENAIHLLNEKFEKAAGFSLQKSEKNTEKNAIIFLKDETLAPEAYFLDISSDKITVKASDFQGYLYAVQSLRLLLPKEIENRQKTNMRWTVPALKINDQPQFAWRGLMLDVVRHFFEKEYIYKTIDAMSLLKMNVLHLHLVDDQGWRIEIKKYPKLTEVGAWRVDQEDKHWDARDVNDPNEKGTYGGFYTQDDIRDIVAYAHLRGIEVMPEIEMPAHVMSALASYPELSCHQKPIGVPSGGVWPITDIYCAGNEQTFTFLEDVLTEVMTLFPSKFIHIGGDEATKTEWKKCPKCQKRMKEHGLKDEHALQTYFINRIEKFLDANGRRLVGWDEIVEDNLSQNAVAMSWRGHEGGVKASKLGNDVIMTPGEYCYLDQYQGNPDIEPITIGGNNLLSKIYTFSPYTDEMDEAQRKHILGGEGTLFSEYVTTESHSQYMIFPRLFALSEAMWTDEKLRNWEDFVRRTEQLFERFDLMGINYAKSMYQVQFSEKVTADGNVEIHISSEYPNADIRYVFGNEDINSQARKYTEPIIISNTEKISAAVFKNGKPFGHVSENTVRFHKAAGKPVTFANRYHKSYEGQQEATLTNIVRGTKNFHDKQWLAWLVDDASFTIDMENPTEINTIYIGVMENQGQGIFLPKEITVSLSDDGKTFRKAGQLKNEFKKNGYATLSDFEISIGKQTARYIKIDAVNLKNAPNGGDAWMFFDEVIVD